MGMIFSMESAVIQGEDSQAVNTAQQDNLNYINEHRENVKKAFEKYFLPLLDQDLSLQEFNNFTGIELSKAIQQLIYNKDIENHDLSKYGEAEFEPYRRHFNPTDYEKSLGKDYQDMVDQEFEEAWIHHYRHNNHHPHFWCKIKENQYEDMPLHCIVHMICDWASFSIKNGSSTLDWWKNDAEDERSCMTEKTKAITDELLAFINIS